MDEPAALVLWAIWRQSQVGCFTSRICTLTLADWSSHCNYIHWVWGKEELVQTWISVCQRWTELIFPALSVQLRRAMVIGAVSDLPICSSCCLVFLCWNSVTEGGKGCLLQAQECFWDGTSVNGMRIASRHEIAFVDYCRVSRHCRGFPKRIWWFLVDLMFS